MSALTLGIEEELFVVDPNSGHIVRDLPAGFLEHCHNIFPKQIIPEFLSSQVEIITKPHANLKDLRAELSALRDCLRQELIQYDLAPIASSTHPVACWREQHRSFAHERYAHLEQTLQIPARRMLVGGMHIHVGIDSDVNRLKVLNALPWFLPLFLLLSTSSPFWAGFDTGLNSFRLNVIDGLPRSGTPEYFQDWHAYERYLAGMVESEAILDGREIWWDARISSRFPTVEMRVTDICTHLDDAIALAALYQAVIHCIIRDGTGKNKRSREVMRMLSRENRWRCQRYDLASGRLIDAKANELISVMDVFSELKILLQEDFEVLKSTDYLTQLDDILERGTSANRQRLVYTAAFTQKSDHEAALKAVVKDLVGQTAHY